MSGPTAPTLVGPKPVVAGRITWVPLACVLAVAAGYVVFFVLPYFVNGLYRYPIEDVAVGYHDPKELWPFDTAWGFVAGLGGLVTLGLGPLVTLGAASGAVILLWRDRAVLDGRGRMRLGAALVVSAVVVAFLASPFGDALMSWFLD